MDLSKIIQSMCMSGEEIQCTIVMRDGGVAYRKINKNTIYNDIEKQIANEFEYVYWRNMKLYKEEKILAFYGYKSFLSNHYSCKIYVDGIIFNSVEQAMMYKKAMLFEDYTIAKKLKSETFPPRCKKLGRRVSNFKESIWDDAKYNIVYKCVFNKFKQNKKLQRQLLNTADYDIVEASYDNVWGVGISMNDTTIKDKSNWGENLLGKILMEVRDELKE